VREGHKEFPVYERWRQKGQQEVTKNSSS